MADFETDFAKYQSFARKLNADLIATHGKAKAKKLFRPMTREQFREFRDAAATDGIKQRWLRRIRSGDEDATADKTAA
jgi:hypothetical protein